MSLLMDASAFYLVSHPDERVTRAREKRPVEVAAPIPRMSSGVFRGGDNAERLIG